MLKDLEPSVPHEYILKGVVNAALGQDSGNRESLKVAQQFFQLVGGSASECGELISQLTSRGTLTKWQLFFAIVT